MRATNVKLNTVASGASFTAYRLPLTAYRLPIADKPFSKQRQQLSRCSLQQQPHQFAVCRLSHKRLTRHRHVQCAYCPSLNIAQVHGKDVYAQLMLLTGHGIVVLLDFFNQRLELVTVGEECWVSLVSEPSHTVI